MGKAVIVSLEEATVLELKVFSFHSRTMRRVERMKQSNAALLPLDAYRAVLTDIENELHAFSRN